MREGKDGLCLTHHNRLKKYNNFDKPKRAWIPKLSKADLEKAYSIEGRDIADIAKSFNTTYSVVQKHIARFNLKSKCEIYTDRIEKINVVDNIIEPWQLRDPKIKSSYRAVAVTTHSHERYDYYRARTQLHTPTYKSKQDLIKNYQEVAWVTSGTIHKNGDSGWHAVRPFYGKGQRFAPRAAAQDAIDRGWITQYHLDSAQRNRIGLGDNSRRYGYRQNGLEEGTWYLVRFPFALKAGITTRNLSRRLYEYERTEGIRPTILVDFTVEKVAIFEQIVLDMMINLGHRPVKGREWFSLTTENAFKQILGEELSYNIK